MRVRAPKVHVKWPTEAHKADTGDNQPQRGATGCKFMMCQNILRAKAAAALFLFVPGLSFARALFGRAADESSNEEGPEGSSIPVFRKGF